MYIKNYPGYVYEEIPAVSVARQIRWYRSFVPVNIRVLRTSLYICTVLIAGKIFRFLKEEDVVVDSF